MFFKFLTSKNFRFNKNYNNFILKYSSASAVKSLALFFTPSQISSCLETGFSVLKVRFWGRRTDPARRTQGFALGLETLFFFHKQCLQNQFGFLKIIVDYLKI